MDAKESNHLEVDVKKIAQDIRNIRHFLNHLEALLNEAFMKGILKDIEQEKHDEV